MTTKQKLIKIQKYSGKTQEELAQALGVSFPTINSWINGRSEPRKKALEKISSLYVEYSGDTSIGEKQLEKKLETLQNLKRQFPDPFSEIISRKDLYERFLLSLTYHTNSIEGSTFSVPDVKAVLFDDVTIPNKTVREHQEAKNHQAALGFAMRWLRDNDGKIDEILVKKIHQILMNGIIHTAGEYRTHSVRIAGSHVPTSNHLSISRHMTKLLKKLNTIETDLLEQIKHLAETHSWFEQIHPFSDGNGRVGRLLMVMLAFKYKLAPVIISQEKKHAYYAYLKESQLNHNSTPLTSFLFDSLYNGYRLLSL